MLFVGFCVLDTNGKQAVNMLKLPQLYWIYHSFWFWIWWDQVQIIMCKMGKCGVLSLTHTLSQQDSRVAGGCGLDFISSQFSLDVHNVLCPKQAQVQHAQIFIAIIINSIFCSKLVWEQPERTRKNEISLTSWYSNIALYQFSDVT